jgi:hypothetical protein
VTSTWNASNGRAAALRLSHPITRSAVAAMRYPAILRPQTTSPTARRAAAPWGCGIAKIRRSPAVRYLNSGTGKM